MADQDDQRDDTDQDTNLASELSDEQAEALLADAVAADDSAEYSDSDDQDKAPEKVGKDWRAEAERWKLLSRKNERSYKDAAAKLKQYEDEGKTEMQRLQEERDQLREASSKSASESRAMRVAMDRAPEHATLAHVRAVAKRVSGDDDESLETDADELFELVAPEPQTPKTPSRPKERLREERLRGGSEPDEEPTETDPQKLAALIPRRR